MLKFSQEHTWIDTDNGLVGISDFAQKSLGDIVFIELPELRQVYSKGERFGSIESAKSVSELFAPVSMKVVAINEIIEADPEMINSDPYGQGWILKAEIIEKDQLDELLSEGEYLDIINKE
ncbi:MAG: glycine cleavage system protein GcvH [Dehalobacterium sp.]